MASVLCIAGLDPSGHAGLSADIRALNHLGVHCMPVATTLTVQNGREFFGHRPVPHDLILRQLDAVFEAGMPGVVKLGMLGEAGIARAVAGFFSGKSIPMVTDPVLGSSSGFRFVDDDLLDIYKARIFPLSSIITPNSAEASAITGMEVRGPQDAEAVCRALHAMSPGSVLVKGGHFQDSKGTDAFYNSSGLRLLHGEPMASDFRGTGCAYASLIAGHMSLGSGTMEAAIKAKADMDRALLHSSGKGSARLEFGRPSQGAVH